MLVIEDQFHPRLAMDLQDIVGPKGDVVILQDEAMAGAIGKALPRAGPSITSGRAIAIEPTDVDDHDALRALPQEIEHLGLALDIVNALARQLFVGAIQDDVLRGMEGEAQRLSRGDGAESPQL